jgi:hypothetical protein
MMILTTNRANFFGRFIFLAGILLLAYVLIKSGLSDPKNGQIIFGVRLLHFDFKAGFIMYFMIAMVAFLIITIMASLFGINKVQVDTITNTITFFTLFTKRTISIADISEYSETVHKNAFKKFYGLQIRLNDNQAIQIAGQNVRSIADLKEYLTKQEIRYTGQEKMKFPFN